MADETLVEAAGRIADGEHVDWGSISSTLKSDYERSVADELAVLSRIAAGHRQLHELLPVAPDTPPNLIPDRTRWGHLDLLNIVGRGSYGTVYRAWDTRLERLVALKLFHGAQDPDAVMQEGRMLARVRHENVVTVYGADIVDGVAGLWMELVHGRTLDQIVKDKGPMDPLEAAKIGADVSRALEAVHAAGLLHCDIKAQNVVRETTGRVVLMDLGAGRLVPEARDSDQLSDVAGTPRYMAPELFHAGADATKSTDIYSFGVLLYYLVSARFPVDGKSLGELKQAHLEARVTPLKNARADVPVAYATVVARALDRDPAKRFTSAAEIQSALSSLAAPKIEPSTSRTIGLWSAAALAAGLLTFAVLGPWATPPSSSRAGEIRSIAVLPIKNLTGDSTKTYIADGITEVLISNLAAVRTLRVPSFAAVAPLRESSDPPSELAKKLGTQLLLAGSMTVSDAGLRLALQLVDSQGTTLWTDALDRDPATILSTPTDVMREIGKVIGIAPRADRLTAQRRIDPRAQTAYFRGLSLSRRGLKEARDSVQLFREAVEIEPGFAAAWAELALAESIFVPPAGDVERAARRSRIRSAAERAISLDPQLASGYAALANEQFYFEWDFPAAEHTFRQALETDPSYAFASQRLAMLLAALGRLDEAIALAKESQALEPLYSIRTEALGTLFYYQRDFDNAIAQMRHALELSPGSPSAHYGLGRIYSAMGRNEEAVEEIEASLKNGRISAYLAELARVYSASGRQDQVERVMAELDDRSRQGDPISPDRIAYLAAAQGRIDDAFRILESARDRRSQNLLWIAVDPRVDPLRKDPRFTALMRSIKLVP